MATIKLYLTSLEPNMSQTIYSQSIGGYASDSLLYPETELASTIGLYDTSINLSTPSSGNWIEWQNIEYINIGNEVIRVSPISNGSVSVVERGYNGIINMHIENDLVMASSAKEIFNNVFNDDHKQYRCLVAKNVSSSDPSWERTAYNISIYLKQNSRGPDANIKIALERPSNQYLLSTSTSWSTMQVIDTSLIGLYSDNYFQEAYLKILSGGATGQGKIISSFDNVTGTFTFYSSLSASYDYTTNVSYEVYSAPAQRIKTGTVSPITTGNDVLPFSSPTETSPVRFASEGSFPVVSDLGVNDVVYIWLERTLEKGAEAFNIDDITLDIKYSVSE